MQLKRPRVILVVIVLATCTVSLSLSGLRLLHDYTGQADRNEFANAGEDQRIKFIDCDLGVVPRSSSVDRSIEICNSSKERCTLKSVTSDCGCIINDVQPSFIAPGSSSTLNFRYRAPSVTGKIQRHIHIGFNEPESPIVVVRVGGLVRNWLESDPQEIEFQETLPGDVSQKEIQISTLTSVVASDCVVKFEIPWLRVDYLSSSDFNYEVGQAKGTLCRYRLTFAPPVGSTAGVIKGKLSFSYAQHELQVSCISAVAAPYTIDCRSLFFGFVRYGMETKVQFGIRLRTPAQKYKLDDFSINHDLGRELDLSIQPGDHIGEFKVIGTFHPENRSGPRNGVLTINTKDKNQSSIPVSGWVK